MGLLDRAQRMLTKRAQPYIDEPVIGAANFTWTVSVQTASSATSHPELAGGLPQTVLVALTKDRLYVLAGELNRVTHEAKRDAVYEVLGHWPRSQVRVTRFGEVKKLLGRELPEPYTVQLELPGREPAQMAGTQGATNGFMRLLSDPTAG